MERQRHEDKGCDCGDGGLRDGRRQVGESEGQNRSSRTSKDYKKEQEDVRNLNMKSTKHLFHVPE